MDQTFFGFNPSDRVQLHENLFELIWLGDGRWSFTDIYTMPIPMRRMWANKLTEKLTKTSTNTPKSANIAKPPM